MIEERPKTEGCRPKDGRSRKRKVDCNAVYHLLEEGLWWPILEGKRLAIVSGQADALAARLMEGEFVRATGGNKIAWSVSVTVSCPPIAEPKRTYLAPIRDRLFAAEWDLLLSSAGAFSAILAESARQAGRRALDLGALDANLIAGTDAPPSLGR